MKGTTSGNWPRQLGAGPKLLLLIGNLFHTCVVCASLTWLCSEGPHGMQDRRGAAAPGRACRLRLAFMAIHHLAAYQVWKTMLASWRQRRTSFSPCSLAATRPVSKQKVWVLIKAAVLAGSPLCARDASSFAALDGEEVVVLLVEGIGPTFDGHRMRPAKAA